MNSIIFDIDGTICPIKESNEKYENLIPDEEMVKKIKELKSKGFKIVLFTSRNMRTYDNDINMIIKHTKPLIESRLERWNIPYDDLIFGKPWSGPSGFYVDDRTIRPKELLSLSSRELEKKMSMDRI